MDCQGWGAGANGTGGLHNSRAGDGGGGGAYAEETTLAVTPGNVYNFTIGAANSGTSTSFPGDSVTVTAHAATSSSGGTAGSNTIAKAGGQGGGGSTGTGNRGGGGGGGSGGASGAGGAGSTGGTSVGGTGGTAGSGGGAAGGNGGGPGNAGSAGGSPGAGGGGGGSTSTLNGSAGSGNGGQITLIYSAPAAGTATLTGVGTLTAQGGPAGDATLAGVGTLSAVRAGAGNATLAGAGTLTAGATQAVTATLTGVGTLSAAGGLPAPACVNQWAADFVQPPSFGTTPPRLQSLVVSLTPASSVGGGSGTPTAGNWLFCLTGWNQDGLPASTVADADDIHSFWRPGDETTSTWAVSSQAGDSRCSIWYTPNLASAPGNVYVAPDGVQAGQACLIVEIAGLGPWDTVTGVGTNYSAAATSLGLSLSAPGVQAFTIACVCGDTTAVTQAFAPASWTALSAVSVTNGSDNTCDAVLTSAFLPSTSGSISVTGTASAASDLSGVILQVRVTGSSPIPAANNPAWPYLKFEAALGGGFQTPPDQLTWTDLSSRLWSWDETTGIQYQLGSIQATNLEMELDNFDAHLSSDNPSSPYYPDLVTGTPLRIRAALGVIGGVTVNRWYVISRNMQEWPQQIDPAYRRYITGTGTDIWSVLSASGPSPYRGEVYQDSPYAWWPMDDQPLTGGVLPASLRNSAQGNTNVLNVVLSPNGATAQNQYGVNGNAVTAPTLLPSIAGEAFAANAGWMYGDPQSGPASYQTSNPVTSNPGSASWQASGQLGNTGSYGFVLICNDTGFPPLSAGVTVEGWFNYQFFGGSASATTGAGQVDIVICQQPYTALTLWELATGSNPVAILQLDLSGHLNFITYSGATPTSHSIYTASDMRSDSWWHIAVTMTATAWTVYVNGGVTAVVSGTAAGMTSAWTWLIANGDLGASGGSSAGTGLVHGGNASFSHLAVYPSRLPAWRILARYCAAMTAFGIVPAPQAVAVTLSPGSAASNTTFAPDGSIDTGTYSGGFGSATVTYSAVATSVVGGFSSGPSAWATTVNYTLNTWAWVGWNGAAAQFNVYTATGHGTETLAAVVAGAGDSFSSGYGAGASGAGKCQVSGGTGASPPASASALGDTVAQRLERILGYGQATYPGRCIDPAPLPVQAATDIGGQQTGQNLENIAQSDGGLMFIDNLGNLTYWQKSHLAAQYASPVWTITPQSPPTPGATLTAYPYYREGYRWLADPQRVWNAILITPFSPDGASLADITPSNATSANASQAQYGAQPRQVNSYLQSATGQQSQADWILSNFGQVQIRVDNLRIDAAAYPAAWPLVLGINVGDVVTVQNWQIGGGGITGTFRISNVKRVIRFGDDREPAEASVVLQADFEPSSYWS